MDSWFLQHKDGICFNLVNATGFKIIDDTCHVFYNGEIIKPTLSISKVEYPDKFEMLRKQYTEISENAPPKQKNESSE